jgi:hypothetical protein
MNRFFTLDAFFSTAPFAAALRMNGNHFEHAWYKSKI